MWGVQLQLQMWLWGVLRLVAEESFALRRRWEATQRSKAAERLGARCSRAEVSARELPSGVLVPHLARARCSQDLSKDTEEAAGAGDLRARTEACRWCLRRDRVWERHGPEWRGSIRSA